MKYNYKEKKTVYNFIVSFLNTYYKNDDWILFANVLY